MRYWLTLLLLFSLIVLAAAQAQDPPRKANDKPQGQPSEDGAGEDDKISVETNLVVVNVTITDMRDRFVSGLKPSEFSVLEDQVPQKIVSFSYEETPFSAVILLDTSASMEPKMSLARAACARFANGLREGDAVAIYSFGGTKIRMLQDFTELRDVADEVWDLKAEGNTPLYDGMITSAAALGKRSEKRRAILLVSDGADTSSRHSLEDAIRKVTASGIAVYAVDLSDSALYHAASQDNGAQVLREFCVKTGGRFFRTPGGSKLRDAFTLTVEELRNQYTLTYEPSNDRRDGRWRAIEVRLNRPKMNVRTRQGYHAPKAHS
jgi:Ca-activated chloride channel family protein